MKIHDALCRQLTSSVSLVLVRLRSCEASLIPRLLFGLERKIAKLLSKRKRIVCVALATVYLCLALLVSYKANDNLVYAKWNVIVSAHRGDFESAPENSIQSVRTAIQKGYQSVELDVQLIRHSDRVDSVLRVRRSNNAGC